MINAPSPSEKKQSALIIGIIALCIHGGLGSLFFLSEPTHSWLNADKAQVILFDEQKCNKPPHTTLVPEKEEWARVLPADGNSLAAAESLSLEESTQTDQKQKSTSLATAESLSPKKSSQTDTKQNMTALTTTESPSPIKTANFEEKQTASAQTTRSTQHRYGSPSSKQLSLASLGKGFLEQLPKATYGRNFMPGSERAKLAASQIAVEEYNARLEKMVSPIFHAIVREIPLPKNVSRSPDFRTNFSPEGKLTEITILQSSGNESYDQQVLKKIKESNIWGPPLPESVRIAREEKHLNSTFYY